MKRIALVMTVAATLAITAPAFGGIRHYVGEADPAGKVDFDGKTRNGKVRRVLDFHWVHVPINCQGNGDGFVHGTIDRMRVRSRKFHKTLTDGGVTAHVEGEFHHHFKQAIGILRVRGDLAGHTGCHTGAIDWFGDRT